MPDAEIVVGRSRQRPFCKTEAFNNAAKASHGKVLVLLDADAYLPGRILERAAARILDELPGHLWFVPYRRLYRLSEETTREILASDPEDPYRPPDPCPPWMLEGDPRHASYGRRYGAMAIVIPRRAYDVLGGFDERFKGWGGEDAALLRALDVLWGKHKSINAAIYHLWHPKIGETYRERSWEGQKARNDALASRYHRASRSPKAMRKLVDEAKASRRKTILLVVDRIVFRLRRLP